MGRQLAIYAKGQRRVILKELPTPVIELLQSSWMSGFATVSAAGVPIDTPMLYFPSEGMRSFDVATGLAYPAKAERARRNPKVGLLVEGSSSEPVVAIAGLAAVQDADLQANTDRYLAETGFALVGGVPWSFARNAVWYWTRMIVQIAPVHIYWWDNPAAMDATPHRWDAPADAVYPQSDPAPPGEVSAASKWPERPWQDLAQQALERNAPGHLTLCDAEGFPLSMPVRSVQFVNGAFHLRLPKGALWRRAGKAALTFQGRETFVGTVTADGDTTIMMVERALPIHPQMDDPITQWKPLPENREKLMRRLEHETARRGQAIPTIPELPPELTAGAKRRMARIGSATQTELTSEASDSPLNNIAAVVADPPG
jgi:hypothetical protein